LQTFYDEQAKYMQMFDVINKLMSCHMQSFISAPRQPDRSGKMLILLQHLYAVCLWWIVMLWVVVCAHAVIYTVSQKTVPPLICYYLDIHYPITIILGRSVTEKVIN